MATRTRTGTTTYKSKSDHARALFKAGKTVADVTREVPGMGYAFAYGIAKRLAESDPEYNLRTSAQPRKTRSVRVLDGGAVEVMTTAGKITVYPGGKVVRSKS